MPSSVDRVVATTLDALLNDGRTDTPSPWARSRFVRRHWAPLHSLCNASRENINGCQRALSSYFSKRLVDSPEPVLADLLLSLLELTDRPFGPGSFGFSLDEAAIQGLSLIVQADLHLASRAIFYAPDLLIPLLEHIGPLILLDHREIGYELCFLQEIIARILLHGIADAHQDYLTVIGWLKEHPLPWFSKDDSKKISNGTGESFTHNPRLNVGSKIGATCVFCQFLITAFRNESHPGYGLAFLGLWIGDDIDRASMAPEKSRYDLFASILGGVRHLKLGHNKLLPDTLLARAEKYTQPGLLEELLAPIPLEDWQRALMLGWARGQTNLMNEGSEPAPLEESC